MAPDATVRPVMLSARDRAELDGLAASLERRNFKKGAELLRGIALKWDGAEHLALVDVRTKMRLNGGVVE